MESNNSGRKLELGKGVLKITRRDYTAVLVFVLTITFVYILITNPASAAVPILGPMVGGAVEHYLGRKRNVTK